MKKQLVQFGVIIIVLIACIGGYFAATHYSDTKEAEESQEDTIEAFKIDETKIVGLAYTYDNQEIQLSKNEDKWLNANDHEKNLDSSSIEDEMLVPLSQINASQKIENPENLSEYGFETDDKGVITPKTNTITATDSENNTYTIYIGTANPYESSKYYMMVQGDNNVYVIDSTVVDAFSKSVDDLEEETTTIEETTVEEVTSED